ncbi:unnamed protein product, partial [Musa acuminata subsp. burmannicoides]
MRSEQHAASLPRLLGSSVLGPRQSALGPRPHTQLAASLPRPFGLMRSQCATTLPRPLGLMRSKQHAASLPRPLGHHAVRCLALDSCAANTLRSPRPLPRRAQQHAAARLSCSAKALPAALATRPHAQQAARSLAASPLGLMHSQHAPARSLAVLATRPHTHGQPARRGPSAPCAICPPTPSTSATRRAEIYLAACPPLSCTSAAWCPRPRPRVLPACVVLLVAWPR